MLKVFYWRVSFLAKAASLLLLEEIQVLSSPSDCIFQLSLRKTSAEIKNETKALFIASLDLLNGLMINPFVSVEITILAFLLSIKL